MKIPLFKTDPTQPYREPTVILDTREGVGGLRKALYILGHNHYDTEDFLRGIITSLFEQLQDEDDLRQRIEQLALDMRDTLDEISEDTAAVYRAGQLLIDLGQSLHRDLHVLRLYTPPDYPTNLWGSFLIVRLDGFLGDDLILKPDRQF